MKNISRIIGLSLLALACGNRPDDSSNLITIVDISNNDRIQLGKQLRIINKYSPRVIALDFFLVPDSLDKDTILVEELNRAQNTVQVVGLHNFDSVSNSWQRLEVSNSKFIVSEHGFSNISITEDSIFIRELPMYQIYKDSLIQSFSYAIAKTYSGVKPEYQNKRTEFIEFPYLRLDGGYEIIRSEDLLSESFSKNYIEDKIVIMGFVGYADDYYLDHGREWKVNGVAIHAAIVNEILNR